MYGQAISNRLPSIGFKWVEETSQFYEDFIKSYNNGSGEGIFLKLVFNIPKICLTFTMILLERINIGKEQTYVIKKNKLYT